MKRAHTILRFSFLTLFCSLFAFDSVTAQQQSVIDSLQKQADRERERVLKSQGPALPRTLLNLLRRQDVIDDLGVDATDLRNRLKGIQSVETEYGKKRSELYKQFDLSKPEESKEYYKQTKELEAELEKNRKEAIEEVLTPEEYKRVLQISVRKMIKSYGLSEILIYSDLREKLSLSDRQLENLRKEAEIIMAEKERRLKKMEAEFDNKVLELLSIQQKLKLQEVVGRTYEHPPNRNASIFSNVKYYEKRIRDEIEKNK
ncbi:MAG: hypothetical protein AAF483_12460 [Planctomycetota bacterium]